MTVLKAPSLPLSAERHRGARAPRWGGAVALLTTFVVLLFAVPSNAVISGLGSLGRPSQLWGLVLLMVWVLTRLQSSSSAIAAARQPIKLLLGVLLTIALVSFAAAMLRGQPADQVSPATTAIIRLLSWTGVVLVAADGLRTRNEISTLIRRIVIGATLLAVLGLAQFASGQSLLDWVALIPGIDLDFGGVDSRGQFTRAAGTSVHPLEFTATMAGCLPLAVATAAAGGYLHGERWRRIWWVSPALILIVSALAVSRSATIGLFIAAAASIPSLPRAYRWVVTVGGAAVLAVVVAVVPGLLSTTLFLFTNAADDSSTQSRTNALARLPEFVAPSPFIGTGFGTFMSRYYIFDNQWVITLIDLGVLGLLALIGLVVAAIWSAASAGRQSMFIDAQMLGRAIAAAVLTVAVLFLFFDGFSFSIAAGFLFLLIGLAAAVRNVGMGDRTQHEARVRLAEVPVDDSSHPHRSRADEDGPLPQPVRAQRAEG